VLLLDGNGNILATTLLSGTGKGGLGVLVPGNVIPVAGDGNYLGSSIGDTGSALNAELYLPAGVTLDGAGNIYIADSLHNRIRKVTAATGIITTIAGNGNPAYTGDNGLAVNATLSNPNGVTLDGAGNLYIADTGNNAIRVIWLATGVITTIAGTGAQGNGGDGGLATSATLNQPWGVTLDPQGDIFIADTSNHRIRMICAVAQGTVINGTACPAAGAITTVAGSGMINGNGSGGFSGDNGQATHADLNFPYTVAFDAAENMYIPDQENDRVRRVNASGTITTFAGTGAAGYTNDGQAATSAELWAPSGVAVDPAGNVYIADSQNSAIRKVSSSTGFISTLTANRVGEYVFPGQPLTLPPPQVSIYGPIGLYLDGWGNLYFADFLNQLVQEVQSNFSVLDFTVTPVRQGEVSAPQSQTVENDGNGSLPWVPTSIMPDPNATVDTAGTTCAVGTPLAVDAQCVVSVEFSPSLTAPPINLEEGNVDVASVAVNTPLDIILVGDATPVNSTTVVVTSNIDPSTLGTTVTFTATVSTGEGTGALVGAVTFSVDGVPILGGAIPVTDEGTDEATATYPTATLPVGNHNITAQYMDISGTHISSPTSPTLIQTVIEGTGVTLVSSQNPSTVGQSVTFTATVASGVAGGVIPDGTVTFEDGSAILVTVPVSAIGTATYTTATLTNGLHPINATYNGDPTRQIQASVSNVVNQDVVVPSTVVLVSNTNPSAFGNPVAFTATVTSSSTSAPTGAVNFFDGATQIGTANLNAGGIAVFTSSTLAAGTHSITAVYAGDNFNGSSTSIAVPQLVKPAATATALIATPTPAIAGGPVVLTATITVTQGVSNPTGTVTFTSGATNLGSAAVGANETATLPVTFPPGSQSIVATYSGDTNDTASNSTPLPLTVQIATTTSTVTSNLNPSVVLAPVTFSVKVTGNGGIPTGTVTFSADGVAIGTGTLDATGMASVSDANLAVGSHSITAVYGGDTNDAPSTSTALSQVVGTIPTATALGASIAGGNSPEVILVATVVGATGTAPTGTVTFQVGNVVLGSAPLNSSGVAILAPNLPAGSENVVAVYSGDALHSASQSQPVSVSSVPLDFAVTVTPASVKLATSQSAVLSVALTSYSGFTDTIGLGCASLPAAVNCHFSTLSAPLIANGTQTVQLTIDTNNPLGGGTSTSSAQRPGAAKALLAGLTLPLSLFFGCLFWRLRKRHHAVFTTLAVVLFGLASMALTACSGFTQVSAAPGTYVIQVTGTGNNSDIQHYQNVTITITK
jgi:sugar lactone lactonase YvrE